MESLLGLVTRFLRLLYALVFLDLKTVDFIQTVYRFVLGYF